MVEESWRKTIVALLGLLAFLIIGHQISVDIHYLAVSAHSFSAFLVFLPILLLSLGYLHLIHRTDQEVRWWVLAVTFVVITSIARLIWLLNTNSVFVSDFGRYWNCGQELWSYFRSSTPVPECKGVYVLRSIFYTLPLRALFGDSHLALKLLNLAFITGTVLLSFDIARELFGVRVAALSTPFLVWSPELWFMITLPTHDVPGMFWLTTFFWLSLKMLQTSFRGSKRRFIIAVLIGINLFLLNFQRSYEVPAVASLLFTAFLMRWQTKSVSRHLSDMFILCGVPILVAFSCSNLFWNTSGIEPATKMSTLQYVSAIDVHSNNRYYQMRPWHEMKYHLIPEEDRTSFALRKIAHEVFSKPYDFAQFLVRKNETLANPHGYIEFGLVANPPEWVGGKNSLQMLRMLCRWVSVLTLFFSLVGLLRILFSQSHSALFGSYWPMPFGFCIAAYLIILLIGEAQFRYDVFLACPLSWLAGYALSPTPLPLDPHKCERGAEYYKKQILCNFPSVGNALALIVGLVGIYIGLCVFVSSSPYVLTNQQGFDVTSPSAIQIVEDSFKRLVVRYRRGKHIPAGSTFRVSNTVKRVRPSDLLRIQFFLSRGILAQEDPWSEADIEIQVYANGNEVLSERLSSPPLSYFVSKQLTSQGGRDAVQIDIDITNHQHVSEDLLRRELPLVVFENLLIENQ